MPHSTYCPDSTTYAAMAAPAASSQRRALAACSASRPLRALLYLREGWGVREGREVR